MVAYNVENDKSGYKIGYNRKTKLTLQSLNKLRKIREGRKLELLIDQQLDSIIYGQPGSDDSDNMSF